MNFKECFKSSIRNVFANKMRTFLTMLGIIIGISSGIIIVSIGNGSQAAIEEEFESFSAGAVTISINTSSDISQSDLFTIDDKEIIEGVEGVKAVSMTISGQSSWIKLSDPSETTNASVTGVTSGYKYVENPTMLYGRFVSDNDVYMQNAVCVINDTTAIKIFGEASEAVLGEKITVKTWRGSRKYKVVGIMENTGADITEELNNENADTVILPITTAQRLYSTKTMTSFSVIPTDANDSEAVGDAVIAAISEKRGTEDKYRVRDTSDMVDSINSILSYVTLFISFVAGISLLVGGIGVMNIMMVTVTERTREIGIRKAIGAKNADIRIQFLMEAIILTGLGGLIGLILGFAGAYGVGAIVDITPVISPVSIAVAVGISMIIGIVFGVSPANKAARLDPIDALRYD